MNRDPIGEEGSNNIYAFVENQPVDKVDPDGRFLFFLTGCAAETDCQSICARARKDSAIRSEAANRVFSGGTIICLGNKKCPCVFGWPDKGINPGDCPALDKIVKGHEEQHLNHTECSSAKKGLHIASTEGGIDLNQEECRLRKEDIDKLETAIASEAKQKCKTFMIGRRALLKIWVGNNCE